MMRRRDGGRGEGGRTEAVRAHLPLLDRLIDLDPSDLQEPVLSPAEALELLRRAVRRDLEALLNARRPWRSLPAGLPELKLSPLGYGITDFAAGAFNAQHRREQMRTEIEETIRRFEPRFKTVRVVLLDQANPLDTSLHLRIDALLHADPAPEPVTFDTTVDAATTDVTVRTEDVATFIDEHG